MRSRAEIHNPLLALPAVRRIQALPRPAREALRDLLREISSDAAARAQHSWKKNKAPMAAYWKAVSVYAKHAARCARCPITDRRKDHRL